MPPAPDRPPAGAAAEEAAAPDDAPKPSAAGGFKAWLPLIITLVAMPVLAYAMTTFVLLPRLQQGLGITAPATPKGESSKPKPGAKKEYATMNKLLVNVAGTMGSRYLLVSLSLVSTETNFKDKVLERDPELRDAANGILRTKTLADLEKPAAVNLIRTELLASFNNILEGSMVQEIYLTEFAIQ